MDMELMYSEFPAPETLTVIYIYYLFAESHEISIFFHVIVNDTEQ